MLLHWGADGDHPDDSLLVSGIVAPHASEAVYVIAAVATSTTQAPVPARLSGLDRSERYHVAQVGPAVQGPRVDLGDSWLDGEPLLLPGSVLGSAGIRLPVMAPESARVLRLRARRRGAGHGLTCADPVPRICVEIVESGMVVVFPRVSARAE